ncbi:hypothetical protein BN938_2083 [Mucinivorans hirudinis]|uniref:Uncharacterized protein n=1 Tax=Mucinivorans hirudinis TaxID=1433126 RepID=A0A060R981_9BACT|nr:hypothetical protein BN938_2083 [Mucinivorans hirudinis]
MQKNTELVNFKNAFTFGLVVCLGVTLCEVVRDKQFNFFIFKLSTLDFWNGVMPYGEQWFSHGYDYYLYSPIFNVLFTPFAYLPKPCGEFAWNLFNYLLLAYAVYKFPQITPEQKARALLYLMLIIAPSQLSFQFNPAIAAFFLLAFSLLEQGKGMLAVLIIMVSALTKIYGVAELAILAFYPRFWRNIAYTAIFGAILAALPLVKLSVSEYGSYVQGWFAALAEHKASRTWQTIFDCSVIQWNGMRFEIMPYIQVGVFMVVALFVLIKRELWQSFSFRAGILASIMGWCVVFGNSTETHTYLIFLSGFALWYYTQPKKSKLIEALYWAVFVVVVVMPIDLLCPPSVMHFVFDSLDLNKYLLLMLWGSILWRTMSAKECCLER